MKKQGKKKNKKKSSSGEIKFTVIGEWFQGHGPADPMCKEGETPVDTEARLFCACVRWAFNRLMEGRTREELKVEGQGIFGINSRFVDDAILQAGEVVDSQRQLLPTESKETETKLARAKRKLAHADRDLERVIKENDSAKIDRAKRLVHGRRLRVAALAKKLASLKAHQEAGTIPKVVFGGRSLWDKVCRGRATNDEWRAARQNRLYSRGDATKGDGNPNIKIRFRDGEFVLLVTISHLSKENGVDKAGRRKMTRAPQVAGKLWIPEKLPLRIWELLASGAEYSVELIKSADGRFRAHITFTVQAPCAVSTPDLGHLGVDTNPDGVTLANIGYTGQPEAWPEGFTVPYPKALHKFHGEFQVTVHPNGFLYIKIPELEYIRSFRRTYLIGVLAKVVVDIAKGLGKPLAVEKLEFGKDRLNTNRRFNRMAANFPFRKVIEAITRKAFRERVGVKQVWPAHTSTIGRWKYMQRYGVTVHHAAAMVIARRAIGFSEPVTAEVKQRIGVVQEKLRQQLNSRPGEGRGMIRKTRRLFNRLDGKILIHNGLTRFKQESFHSVWHDLKRLALSSR